MEPICIDTDILIDLLWGKKAEKIKELEQENACLRSHLLEHIKLYFMYNKKMPF